MRISRTFSLALLLVAGSVTGGPAWAQKKATQPAPKVAPAAPAPETKPKHYDFDDDTVEGGVFTPDGTMIESKLKANMPSLLKPRSNFIAELIKSAEDQ